MKRLLIFAFLCPFFYLSYGQDTIELNGTNITVKSDKLTQVNNSTVWEIDPDSVVEFSLISKNTSVIYYQFDKKCVWASYNNQQISYDQIPHMTQKNNDNNYVDTPQFYKSAKLKIFRELLPIKLYTDNKEIAKFVLKKKNEYEQLTLSNKGTYLEGDTLIITKKTNSDKEIIAKTISVFLRRVGDKDLECPQNIIPPNVLKNDDSALLNVIIKVTYDDETKIEVDAGAIMVKKKNDWLMNIINNTIFQCIIIIIFIIVLVYFCREKLKKIFEHLRKNNDNADSPAPQALEKLKTMLYDKKNAIQDLYTKIEDLCSRLKQIKTDSAKPQELEELKQLLHQKKNAIQALSEEIDNLSKQLNDSSTAPKLTEWEELLSRKETAIRDLNQEIFELNGRLADLSTHHELEKLKKTITEKEQAIQELNNQLQDLNTKNQNLQNDLNQYQADAVTKRSLRDKIQLLTTEIAQFKNESQQSRNDLSKANQKISKLEAVVKEKEDKMTEINRQKEESESNLRIEKNAVSSLKRKIDSFSKQTYYLFSINDTLKAVDESLKTIFAGVQDDNLMKRLAQPIISGTAGLDAGIESYSNDWNTMVFDNPKQYFGDDILNLSDETVKEKLASDFLEQLALRDSFGKLVRLYLMTNVGWINEQMVSAGFDVDAIQVLFARFKNLFSLFDIEISYPHLFVDKFDARIHKDNMRCEIFNYFKPSNDLLLQLKTRENEDLIVDVTRIGIPSSKTSSRRCAMVSLPNF